MRAGRPCLFLLSPSPAPGAPRLWVFVELMNKRINERGKRPDVRLSRPHLEAGLPPSAMLAGLAAPRSL